MAIFGNITVNGTLVHVANTGDLIANIIFSTLLIILFAISCIANIIVFTSHRRQKQNVSAVLFELLSANDFLTCIVGIPPIIYLMIYDEEMDCNR